MVALLGAAVGALAGCLEDGVCNTAGKPPNRIAVRDAVTEVLVCGSVVTVKDGSFMETPEERNCGVFDFAKGRAGSYKVTVAAEGYVSTELTMVSTEDECGVNAAPSETVYLNPR